ncbi:MAG: N-acetyl-gamma-glutamyl-phosphate reductase [Aquabacterium sp.]
MRTRLFIDGDQGTTGLRIAQRLQGRDDLHLVRLPEARRKDPGARAEALNDCDIALLCLPDAAAREAVSWVRNPAVRILDASSAHRVHPDWVYGLPELDGEQPGRIAAAQRVSNPGCYPTAAVALLRPLVQAGLLPPDYPVTVQAVSGYSGRGRAGVDAYEGPGRAAAPAYQAYGLGLDHKHAPEIHHHAGLAQRPLFLPAYGAYAQGIVLTIALHRRLLPPPASAARLHEVLHERYRGARHVQVLTPADSAALGHLDPQALNGTDDLRLMVLADATGEQVVLAAVLDNLGKGASGAALQNLALMMVGGANVAVH